MSIHCYPIKKRTLIIFIYQIELLTYWINPILVSPEHFLLEILCLPSIFLSSRSDVNMFLHLFCQKKESFVITVVMQLRILSLSYSLCCTSYERE